MSNRYCAWAAAWAISIAACAFGNDNPGAPAGAATAASPKEELVEMVAWTVPSGAFKVGEPGQVQVSLTPEISMDQATLSLVSQDAGLVVIFPGSFSLSGLRPPNAARPAGKKSPPDPPALGMTIMHTFQILARTAGPHLLRVEFASQGKTQVLDVAVVAR